MPEITLAHSPDPDDAFMFYALAENKIDTGSWTFHHILQDIQTLNERAHRGELDITAVSIHAYAYLTDQYALMPCGASMGDGYGPILVGAETFSREALVRQRIAVPGTMTSAFLALQLYLGKPASELNTVVVPFDQIFDALKRGDADVGLVIHEGQITWEDEGFQLSADLGQWWLDDTNGLPLPLGGNVIKKTFSEQIRKN
jgi:1,4-dihydroxy-6-naphthoate synthase